jgi:hypothetical protein
MKFRTNMRDLSGGRECPVDRRVRAEPREQCRHESPPAAYARGMSGGRAGVLLISLFGIAHTHAFAVAPPIGVGLVPAGHLFARACALDANGAAALRCGSDARARAPHARP